MTDTLTIRLKDAQITHVCGNSLASCLYTFPVDILLSGHLGAGKTSFVRGLAEGLGITQPLTSPTYALEQRYTTQNGRPFVHLDLYRLTAGQAERFLAESDDHEGIRCIEWADKIPGFTATHPHIAIHAEEDGDGRIFTITFHDFPLPGLEEIDAWRKDVLLPAHIIAHCRAVAELSEVLADHLIADGIIVRRLALERSAQLHDLLRFIDFKGHVSPPPGVEFSDEQRVRWAEIKKNFPDMHHEEACAEFLRQKGFDALAQIVEPHGLKLPAPERTTIEQKLLYYADKRAAEDRIVSLEERFTEFKRRYGQGEESERSKIWFNEAQNIEAELFPDGPPA